MDVASGKTTEEGGGAMLKVEEGMNVTMDSNAVMTGVGMLFGCMIEDYVLEC